MKVQELLDSPDKWTKEVYARDKDEKPVQPNSRRAVKWCLLGAIRKCHLLQEREIRSKIRDITKEDSIDFNDTHSYEEVIELVRRLNI